ncbi:EamA family transporter [Pseudomonas dryadis]|uniref:EamA family transporter n=2 Tax=Pseudomonadales TaxID=72274 RepID=A0ABY1Z2W8_9GAMM|nr:EamA family transporter [Pseudomonas dryadis]TBV19627.1 EamA family transporter [Pseudomonas sp. FRB 230]
MEERKAGHIPPQQGRTPHFRISRSVAVLFCLASMFSIQLGASLSLGVMENFGSYTTTWIRLCFAAVIVYLIARPNFLSFDRRQWVAALSLGAAMALMTTSVFAAIQSAPLGLVIAINFLGPISVALLGLSGYRAYTWPALSLVGVLLIAYNGTAWVTDTRGLLFSFGAAIGWAGYILLMKRVGSQFKGLQGLSVSLLSAALIMTPIGLSSATELRNPELFLYGAGLAILVPLLPYILEMQALRQLSSMSFGLLMSVEPAIGALLGFLILSQALSTMQVVGVVCVVAASIGALRNQQSAAKP